MLPIGHVQSETELLVQCVNILLGPRAAARARFDELISDSLAAVINPVLRSLHKLGRTSDF